MTGPSAGNCPAQPCCLTETSFAACKLPDRCFRLSSVVARSFNRELASSKHHAREGRTSYFDRRLSESTRTSSKSQPSGLHNLGAGVAKPNCSPQASGTLLPFFIRRRTLFCPFGIASQTRSPWFPGFGGYSSYYSSYHS